MFKRKETKCLRKVQTILELIPERTFSLPNSERELGII